VELLGPLATTAVQTVYAWRGQADTADPFSVAPPAEFINSCHALAEDGEAVRRLWPAPDASGDAD
jgi:hypothetical protein